MVKKKPLEMLFSAMYHGKYDYEDFIAGNVSSRATKNEYTDRVTKKKRVTWIPDKTLKVYHAFLNLFLFDYLLINEEVVYSYRKGVNVATAISLHSKSKHFFQADLQNFFGSVSTALAQRAILEAEATTPILDLQENVNRILDLVTINESLPLGFSTSPAISNAVLRPFDDTFQSYCANNNLIYTRYSDDIIVSTDNKDDLKAIESVITDILDRLNFPGIALRKDKTKISSVGGKIKLLGVMILPNGTVSVDTKLKNYVETLLHLYARDSSAFRDFIALEISDGTVKLSGYLNYIKTIDPLYLDKLRKKYGVTLIDTLIHYSKK